MSHASMEFNANIIAKPTRVAMDELQLHDLKNMDAAVDVKQNARPARHEEPTVPRTPASGIENNSPMVGFPLEYYVLQWIGKWQAAVWSMLW